MNVADDTHQNPGSGWNGDTVQVMFTNSARPAGGTVTTGEIATDAGMILYNYGLKDDGGAYTRYHESHLCIDECTGMAATRDENTKRTQYEFVFPAHALGMDALYSGFTFGLGVCINDGDDGLGQAGQGSWSGWAPYGIVFGGKQVKNNGLAVLVGTCGEARYGNGMQLATGSLGANGKTTCEDLRDQGGKGVGCSANGKGPAQASPEVDDMRWNIPFVNSITLELSDWNGVPFNSQTPFRPCDKVGGALCTAPFVEFDTCVACVSGATWTGITDHFDATAFGWNSAAFYAGIKVYDDTHQNPSSGWNGDTVQIMFTNAARPQGGTATTGEIATPAGMILYNYGLKDNGSGTYTLHHESHPCEDACTSAAMERFEDVNITMVTVHLPCPLPRPGCPHRGLLLRPRHVHQRR